MNPKPTGRVFRTPAGQDLELTRAFRAPIEDVWASITEPDRTARWFGRWWGDGGEGRTIRFAMGFEEGAPEAEMTILVCRPPQHLAVHAEDAAGVWHLEAYLTESNGVTELRFVQHLDAKHDVADIGPGWEYYLDNLAASREDRPLPSFADYHPSQKEYYAAQGAAAEAR